MSVSATLAALVRERARNRCEYCTMSQMLQGATFHLEHILPSTCGGETTAENLALACPSCNLHKSDLSHSMDSASGKMAPLFHPRLNAWSDHFIFRGTTIFGMTATGRTTVDALDLNHPRRHKVRTAEALFGLFPPAL